MRGRGRDMHARLRPYPVALTDAAASSKRARLRSKDEWVMQGTLVHGLGRCIGEGCSVWCVGGVCVGCLQPGDRVGIGVASGELAAEQQSPVESSAQGLLPWV